MIWQKITYTGMSIYMETILHKSVQFGYFSKGLYMSLTYTIYEKKYLV